MSGLPGLEPVESNDASGAVSNVNLTEVGGTAVNAAAAALGQIPTELFDSLGNAVLYTSPVDTEPVLLAISRLTQVTLNISSATTTAVVAAVASQTTRVYRARIYVTGANTLTVKNGATTLEVIPFAGAGSLVLDIESDPYWATSVNAALNITTSTSATVNGVIEYVTSA